MLYACIWSSSAPASRDPVLLKTLNRLRRPTLGWSTLFNLECASGFGIADMYSNCLPFTEHRSGLCLHVITMHVYFLFCFFFSGGKSLSWWAEVEERPACLCQQQPEVIHPAGSAPTVCRPAALFSSVGSLVACSPQKLDAWFC